MMAAIGTLVECNSNASSCSLDFEQYPPPCFPPGSPSRLKAVLQYLKIHDSFISAGMLKTYIYTSSIIRSRVWTGNFFIIRSAGVSMISDNKSLNNWVFFLNSLRILLFENWYAGKGLHSSLSRSSSEKTVHLADEGSTGSRPSRGTMTGPYYESSNRQILTLLE